MQPVTDLKLPDIGLKTAHSARAGQRPSSDRETGGFSSSLARAEPPRGKDLPSGGKPLPPAETREAAENAGTKTGPARGDSPNAQAEGHDSSPGRSPETATTAADPVDATLLADASTALPVDPSAPGVPPVVTDYFDPLAGAAPAALTLQGAGEFSFVADGTPVTTAGAAPTATAQTAPAFADSSGLASLARMLPPLPVSPPVEGAGLQQAAATAPLATPLLATLQGSGNRPGATAPAAIAAAVGTGQPLAVAQPLATDTAPLPAQGTATPVAPGTAGEGATLPEFAAALRDRAIVLPPQAADTAALASAREFAADGLQLAAQAHATADGADSLLRPFSPVAAPTLAAAPPATSALPTAIPVPVADPGWGDALGERVLWMAGQKIGNAEIRMNPVELGPLSVEIKIEDNKAHVTFTAQHGATREALEQALPRLRELFQGQGLTLAQADVGGQQAGDTGGNATGDAEATGGAVTPAAADAADTASPVHLPGPVGLVDTFA